LETELSQDQFNTLWPGTEGRRIEKTRYQIDYEGQKIELNVFRGGLEGLVLAEVEFASREKSEEFKPPDWLGEEVTEDARYRIRAWPKNALRTAKSCGRSDDGRLFAEFFRRKLGLRSPSLPITPEAATERVWLFHKDSCADCVSLYPQLGASPVDQTK
jgi:hypothetical protein